MNKNAADWRFRPRPRSYLWLLFLLYLICLGTHPSTYAQEAVSVETALARGFVEVQIEGTSYYYDRPVVNLYVTNKSETKLRIEVPHGLRLRADDPNLSDLIVVSDEIQTLQRKETDRLFELRIYSNDIGLSFSSPAARYQIVGVVDDVNVLHILEHASASENPLVGQVALWMYMADITDRETIKDLTGLNFSAGQWAQVDGLLESAGIQLPASVQATTIITGDVTPQVPETSIPVPTSSTYMVPEVTTTTPDEESTGRSPMPGIVVGLSVGFAGLALLIVAGIWVIGRRGFPLEWGELIGGAFGRQSQARKGSRSRKK